MNYTALFLLQKLYSGLFAAPKQTAWDIIANKKESNTVIYKHLTREQPCLIARFGIIEMAAMLNYQGVCNKSKNIAGYIKKQQPAWWWEPHIMDRLCQNAGFFPNNIQHIERFCQMTIDNMREVDVLGSWLSGEKTFEAELQRTHKMHLHDLEPFFCENPWTKALQNKKILVVHPFSETITAQYKNKSHIFPNNLLPDFELITIKAVQSIAGAKTGFDTWFDAFESMKGQIDKTDFDICIIGAGAYGFPLAAHVKKQGKKAFHLGGATQLLFGIIGRRWEESNDWPYKELFNEYWVRPQAAELPINANKIEGGCYW